MRKVLRVLPREPGALFALLVGLFMALTVLHIVVNAIARSVPGFTVYGGLDVVMYWAMPLIVFGALALAQFRNEHISATLFADARPLTVQRMMSIFAALMSLAVAAAVLWFGLEQAVSSQGVGERASTTLIPIWPVRYAIPIGAAAYIVVLVFGLVRQGRPSTGAGAASPSAGPDRRDAAARAVSARDIVVLGSLAVWNIACLLIAVLSSDPVHVGLSSIGLVFGLVGSTVPVGIAMILGSVIGLSSLRGSDVVVSTLREMPFNASSSWSLAVIPMFILMGVLLSRSGATQRIFDFARLLTGRVPGGLAVTTTLAGGGLASISGSSIAIVQTLGRIAMPEMLRVGYNQRLAMSTVLSSGVVGGIIPPSILLVVYAGIAQTPVGPQLMAGVVPGVLIVLTFALVIVISAVRTPRVVGGAPVLVPRGERVSVVLRVLPVLGIIIVVLGTIFTGLMTATEAGALGALAAGLLALMLLRPRRGAGAIVWSAVSAAASTASIMLVVIGAAFLTRLISLTGIPRVLVDALEAIGLTPLGLLVLIAVLYILLGMAMEPMSMILLTVPLLLPIVEVAGISPLWFGVYVIILAEIALLTPPMGILSFVMHAVVRDPEVSQGREISLGAVFSSSFRFLPVPLFVLILMILFPGLAEWLPDVSGAG